MGALADFFRPWGPYSVAALGAALLGYGLVSGLLLVQRQGRPFVRPYFMSAFGMALLVFVITAIERAALSGSLAFFKVLVLVVTLAYGVTLLQRCWTRPLASRSTASHLVIAALCAGLPWVPGVVGSVVNRAEMIRAVESSPPESGVAIISQASVHIWTPLVAAALGSVFLGIALLMLLFRRARERG